MFKKESEYNQVVKERDTLNTRVEELETQLANANETNTNLQGQVDTLTSERDTLNTQVEELNTAAETSAARITELEDQVETLTAENEELSALPGAESAVRKSGKETNHGEAKTDLEKTAEFCKTIKAKSV